MQRRYSAPNRLFAYGTLRDPARVRTLLGRGCRTIAASLKNFALRRGRWPYLVPVEGGAVDGDVLLDLGAADFARLDEYEATRPTLLAGKRRKLYTRGVIEVIASDGRLLRCWIYLPSLTDWREAWR